MKNSVGRFACVLSLLMAGSTAQLFGQDRAVLGGKVIDQANTAIPNATVIVRNEASGLTRTVSTASDGVFSVAGLSAGSYAVDASAAGFQNANKTGVALSSVGNESITIQLSVSSVSTSVTVEATISL